MRCWHIQGFDSTTRIFDESIPIEQMTESSMMKELLRALMAKDLSPREVIGAYANSFLAFMDQSWIDRINSFV
jgi:hypothetical protein